MPGPSFSDSAVGAMAPLLGEFTSAQWNAVYNPLSFGFTATGFATLFFWLQVLNMTKSYRVIRDTSTSTNDRVFRAGTSCVLRGVSTSASTRRDDGTSTSVRIFCANASSFFCGASSSHLRRASANGGVYRAGADRILRSTGSSRVRGTCASVGIHCASTCCVIRGTSTSRDRLDSASGGGHRVNAKVG